MNEPVPSRMRSCQAEKLKAAHHLRLVPKLTAAELDRNQLARDLAGLALPDLLLRRGSMAGPYRRLRVPLALRARRYAGEVRMAAVAVLLAAAVIGGLTWLASFLAGRL